MKAASLIIAGIASSLAAPGDAAPPEPEQVFIATGAFRFAHAPEYILRPGLREVIPNAELIGAGPEAGIVMRVERYEKGARAALPQERFVMNLIEDIKKPAVRKALVSGAQAEIIDEIEMGRVVGGLLDFDPYWRTLGTGPPPRLGLFSLEVFHHGGDAYRRYRCKKRGVHRSLGLYEQVREKPELFGTYKSEHLDPSHPRYGESNRRFLDAIETCFGWHTAARMRAGESVADKVPEPSMRELRRMARDERKTRVSVERERMSVAVVPYAGGYYALRYRAPEALYRKRYTRFERLLESFRLEPPAP